MDLERTLILIKPDGVERGLVGQIITRFENAGLKVIGIKLLIVDADFAAKHYTEDLAKRRGEHVRRNMIKFLSSGPVVAIALEGVEAIEVVRKLVGSTEPKQALPGTIRGDFSHHSYTYTDAKDIGIRNLIHASSSVEDAKAELSLWFSDGELWAYDSVHDKHVLG